MLLTSAEHAYQHFLASKNPSLQIPSEDNSLEGVEAYLYKHKDVIAKERKKIERHWRFVCWSLREHEKTKYYKVIRNLDWTRMHRPNCNKVVTDMLKFVNNTYKNPC